MLAVQLVSVAYLLSHACKHAQRLEQAVAGHADYQAWQLQHPQRMFCTALLHDFSRSLSRKAQEGHSEDMHQWLRCCARPSSLEGQAQTCWQARH